MKSAMNRKPLLLLLVCAACVSGLTACGKQQRPAFVTPSKPLPAQIEASFRRHSFDTNTFLRPYEPASLIIAGPGIQSHPSDERIWLDADSRRDGQPIAEAVLQGLQFGTDTFKGEVRLVVGRDFQPWALFPRQPGTYTFDLVLHTGREKWICPPIVVEIRAAPGEEAMVAEFETSGASPFFEHTIGARRASETDAPPLPYVAVADFARKYPDSYLAETIRGRIRRLFLEDLSSCSPYSDGPLLSEDRTALATLIGDLDPRFVELATGILNDQNKSLAASKNPGQLQQQIAISEEWLRLATAASTEKEGSK